MRGPTALILSVILVAAGCGGSESNNPGRDNNSAESETTSPSALPEAKTTAAPSRCEGDTGHLLPALKALDTRLKMRIAFPQYERLVLAAETAFNADYRQFMRDYKSKLVGRGCLAVMTLLAQALNEHISVRKAWQACVKDNCDVNTNPVGSQIAKAWRRAAAFTTRAESRLRNLA